jgi:hypothetical protein
VSLACRSHQRIAANSEAVGWSSGFQVRHGQRQAGFYQQIFLEKAKELKLVAVNELEPLLPKRSSCVALATWAVAYGSS